MKYNVIKLKSYEDTIPTLVSNYSYLYISASTLKIDNNHNIYV